MGHRGIDLCIEHRFGAYSRAGRLWGHRWRGDGVRSAKGQVVIKIASEADPKDLLDCNAVALGSYDAFSYMGGGLKEFFERTFYPTQGQITDKPYAAFVTHGGGGKAIESVESICQVFKLKKAADPVLIKGRPEGQAISDLKELGVKLAGVSKIYKLKGSGG